MCITWSGLVGACNWSRSSVWVERRGWSTTFKTHINQMGRKELHPIDLVSQSAQLWHFLFPCDGVTWCGLNPSNDTTCDRVWMCAGCTLAFDTTGEWPIQSGKASKKWQWGHNVASSFMLLLPPSSSGTSFRHHCYGITSRQSMLSLSGGKGRRSCCP